MKLLTPPQPDPEIHAARSLDGGSVLALGVEVHRLVACLLEPAPDRYRLAAWWLAPGGLQRTIPEQVEELCSRFGKRIGRRLWDEERGAPFTRSTDPVGYPPLQHVTIAASPRPRLRVWVAALTARNSLTAAVSALHSSQAHVIGATSLHAGDDAETLARELNATRPEALVLAGGYDSGEVGTQSALVLLTRHLAAALHGLPDDAMPEVVFAGNPFAFREVAGILQSVRRCSITRVNNVLPGPDRTYVQSLSHALDAIYWRKCQTVREFPQLGQWTTDASPIITVESSFARLIRLWREMNDLPELHGVYTGRDRWFHVWADAGAQQVLTRFLPPGDLPEADGSWPPLRLVSGPWTGDQDLPSSALWWDSSGLAPIAAAAASVAPRAAVDALRADLLMSRRN